MYPKFQKAHFWNGIRSFHKKSWVYYYLIWYLTNKFKDMSATMKQFCPEPVRNKIQMLIKIKVLKYPASYLVRFWLEDCKHQSSTRWKKYDNIMIIKAIRFSPNFKSVQSEKIYLGHYLKMKFGKNKLIS